MGEPRVLLFGEPSGLDPYADTISPCHAFVYWGKIYNDQNYGLQARINIESKFGDEEQKKLLFHMLVSSQSMKEVVTSAGLTFKDIEVAGASAATQIKKQLISLESSLSNPPGGKFIPDNDFNYQQIWSDQQIAGWSKHASYDEDRKPGDPEMGLDLILKTLYDAFYPSTWYIVGTTWESSHDSPTKVHNIHMNAGLNVPDGYILIQLPNDDWLMACLAFQSDFPGFVAGNSMLNLTPTGQPLDPTYPIWIVNVNYNPKREDHHDNESITLRNNTNRSISFHGLKAYVKRGEAILRLIKLSSLEDLAAGQEVEVKLEGRNVLPNRGGIIIIVNKRNKILGSAAFGPRN